MDRLSAAELLTPDGETAVDPVDLDYWADMNDCMARSIGYGVVSLHLPG